MSAPRGSSGGVFASNIGVWPVHGPPHCRDIKTENDSEETMTHQTERFAPTLAEPPTHAPVQIAGRAYAKVAFASAIGTMVEYYDFTLYATATAIVFNRIF